MNEPFICYDCMSVTNGDCGRHGPRIIAVWQTTQPIAEPMPPAPSSSAGGAGKEE